MNNMYEVPDKQRVELFTKIYDYCFLSAEISLVCFACKSRIACARLPLAGIIDPTGTAGADTGKAEFSALPTLGMWTPFSTSATVEAGGEGGP